MKLIFHSSKILCLICWVVISPTTLALSSDKQQVAYLNADSAHYDRNAHISIYTGNVNFHQGTTTLNADKLTVYDDKDTGKIVKVVALGRQAIYTTLPDNKEHSLSAKADTIEYYPVKGLAILEGNGEIAQDGDKLAGDHIIYDINQQTISVEATKSKQTTIVIQP